MREKRDVKCVCVCACACVRVCVCGVRETECSPRLDKE